MDISPNAPKIWDSALPYGITLISDRFLLLGKPKIWDGALAISHIFVTVKVLH
ncbi:MAG: hypothetical protein V7K88_27565 [Nostoc sp.]|uniref:hypothetical protein n=1 Tax=Nostoc sp. TaxID=1180 RepID=UPI002FF61099